MDIKDLNRSQLIMLALLLSFVTSIATGIVTVTLMQQAPDSLVAPINRVVRQTVERIVQVPGNNTVQTIVIKEEDLIVDAISKNDTAIFTVAREGVNEEGSVIKISAGFGFVVDSSGLIVVDGSLVSASSKILLKNSSGEFMGEHVFSSEDGYALVKLGEPTTAEGEQASFTTPTFTDITQMSRGQKIIMLGSIVSSFIYEGDPNLTLGVSRQNAGSMILNVDGEVLGMAITGDDSFVSILEIIEGIDALALSGGTTE